MAIKVQITLDESALQASAKRAATAIEKELKGVDTRSVGAAAKQQLGQVEKQALDAAREIARARQAQGDYAGAVRALSDALKDLDRNSAVYQKITRQIEILTKQEEVLARARERGRALQLAAEEEKLAAGRAKATRAAIIEAQAVARLQVAQGDYIGALRTLSTARQREELDTLTAIRLDTQLEQVKQRATRATAGTGRAADIANRQFRSLTQTIAGSNPVFSRAADLVDSLGGKTALLGGAAVAVGAGLLYAAKSAADYGREVQRAARITTLTTDEVQGLTRGFAAVGQTSNDAIDAVNQFVNRLADARRGSREARQDFAQVGINIRDTSLTTSQALDQVLERLNRAPGSIEKTRVASRLFGEEGARGVLALRDTEGGLDSLIAKHREYGGVVSEESIKRSAEFSDRLREMATRFEGIKIAIGNAAIPAITGFLDFVSEAAARVGAFVTAQPLDLSRGRATPITGSGAPPPTPSPLPPPPPRFAGSRAPSIPSLAPEVAARLERAGFAAELAGKDLSELARAYNDNRVQMAKWTEQLRILADAGALKTREYQTALDGVISAYNRQAEIVDAIQKPITGLPVGIGARGRELLALAPRPQVAGLPVPAPFPEEGRDFVVQLTEAERAAEAYERVLKRLNREQDDFLEIAIESQERLNRIYDINPLEIQARTLDGLARRVRSASELIADAQISAIDSVFDFVDRGFDRITQGVGAFGRVISQVLSDITRLLLHRSLAQFFGIGGSGGASSSSGSGGGGGIGTFLNNIFFGGGGGGGFRTPPFVPGSVAGSSSVGVAPSISGQLAGLRIIGIGPGGTPIFGSAAGSAAGSAVGASFSTSLLGGLAPLAPFLGVGLGLGLGGRSTAGRILGGLGGGFLGAGAGLAAFGAAGGVLSGSAAAFASFALGPIGLLIGGGLLLGSLLLGRAKQRRNDESLADSYWTEEARQIQELTRAVNADRIDGAEALAQAAQLRAQTIAAISQIKTASVRESRLRNQLPDVDRVYVSQLRAAVERQALRRRIGPQLVPEFATGGVVPGLDRGFDSVVALVRPGEVILNRQQQARLQILAGAQIFQQVGVPNYQQGGQVQQPQIVASAQTPVIHVENVTLALSPTDATQIVFEGVSMTNSAGQKSIEKIFDRRVRRR